MNKIKTAVIWNEVEPELSYFLSEEDLSDLHLVYINSSEDNKDKQRRLLEIIYKEGEYRVEFCSIEQFTEAIRQTAGINVIECGFLP